MTIGRPGPFSLMTLAPGGRPVGGGGGGGVTTVGPPFGVFGEAAGFAEAPALGTAGFGCDDATVARARPASTMPRALPARSSRPPLGDGARPFPKVNARFIMARPPRNRRS